MTGNWSGLLRGVVAGAVGTTALNAATQLDMAVRGRPASDAPQQVVTALAERSGVAVPGSRRRRADRIAGLGPLSGTLTGLAVGGVGGVLRAAGLRLPALVGGSLMGAAAMAAADGPLALLRISDPRRWSSTDWVADVVPHLVYGVSTHATIIAAIPEDEAALRRPPAAALVRAAALGAATGARSSMGIAALSLTSSRADRGAVVSRWGSRGGSAVALLLAGGESVLDKLPATPARTAPPGLVPRAALGATSAAAVARRDGHDGTLAGAVGLASALGASVLGNRARALAARRLRSDVPGAVVEDVLAAALGWWGARRATGQRPATS